MHMYYRVMSLVMHHRVMALVMHHRVMALVKIAIFEFVSASPFIYYQFSDVCQTYTVISILKQVCV